MVLSADSRWLPFQNGVTVGRRGSEGGSVVREEEHADGAKICLERFGFGMRILTRRRARFAITCGVYGWMVHTRFFKEEGVAQVEYEKMRGDLESILTAVPLTDDPELKAKIAALVPRLESFMARYP